MSIISELGPNVEADVSTAKDNGCVVEYLKLGNSPFVYRSLNRLEWKGLQNDAISKSKGADGSIDPMKVMELKDESEDAVVMRALIHPKHETVGELAGYPAGYVAQLADKITEASGFGEIEEEPVRL